MRPKLLVSLLAVFFLSLGLSACGGGGSSSGGNPPAGGSTSLAWDQGNWDQANWQ